MPGNKANPLCPACGSSATLPFENEKNNRAEQTFSEILLVVLLLFLVLFIILLLFLLSHAGLPVALMIVLIFHLLWRQKKKCRPPPLGGGQYVCLDCSCNFKA